MKTLKWVVTFILALNVHLSYAASCSANSETSLKSCIASAKGNPSITEILVTTNISCVTNSCSYLISGFTNPLTIIGTTSTSGLRRVGNYNSHLVSIQNSKSISLKNLTIDDGAILDVDRRAPFYGSCPPSLSRCFSAVAITSSSNITLDKVIVNGGKPMGIEAGGVSGLNLTNSTIKDSWIFGLWLSNSSDNFDIIIENNNFIDNRSNGLLFSGKVRALARNMIRNNSFRGNHYNAAFNTCGPSGSAGPCSGGQLLIERNTDKLNLENNLVSNGRILVSGLKVSGIEFAGSGISNVKMLNNNIRENSGYAIVKNDSNLALSNIEIQNNSISDNGLGSFRFPEAIYLGTNAPANLQIYNGGAVTTYNPWVIWAAVNGVRPTTKANLYANGFFWGRGSSYSIPNSSDMSFTLPSSLVSTCNLNRDDCNFQVELYDESAASRDPGLPYALSPKVSIPLPGYRFLILNGGIVMSYNPWVVWLSTEGVVMGTTVKLYTNGNLWGVGSGHATPSANSISFNLPSNTAPNGCNTNREDCNFEIELIHPNGGKSPKYKMPLPAVR